MADKRSTNKTLFDEISSEVTPATSPLLNFLTANARKIAMLALVCVIAGAAYGIYNWQARKQVVAAQESLGRILVTQNATDRLAKLQAFLPGAPEKVKGAVLLGIAKAASEAADHPAAHAAWEALGKMTKGPLNVTAMIGKAGTLDLQGKTAESLAILEGIALPADSAFILLVQGMVADLAEKSGDYAKAIAACEKIIASVVAFNPEEANFWRQKAESLRSRKNTAAS